jgi:hypothetical protein
VSVIEATNAAQGLYWRLKQAVASYLTQLNMTGGPVPPPNGSGSIGGIVGGSQGPNVYVQMLPDGSNVRVPCALVTTFMRSEKDAGGTSLTREWWQPVGIAIYDKGEGLRRTDNEPYYSWWREQIVDFFHDFSGPPGFVPNVPECRGFRVNPEAIFDAPSNNFVQVVSTLMVEAYVTRVWNP